MEFRILGSLEARSEQGELALGGVKPRAVLAVLLLNANQPVSVDRLAGALWGEDVPAGATKTIQVHVSRLRRALGDPEAVVTTAAGYVLQVGPDDLDATRFDRLVSAGRRALARGCPEDAAGLLRQALTLWRGPPLAELAFEPFAQPEIARLEEQRLAALEERVEAELASGWHAPLVGELQQLVEANPTRERLTGQLMLALYRCGRQTDALELYSRARARLVADIGVEPGPELRRLQEAILHQDEAFLRAETSGEGAALPPPGEDPVTPTPLALPLPVVTPARVSEGAFVGRGEALERLRSRWRETLAGEVTVALLIGEPGIGKTRLATRFAEEVHRDGGAVLYGHADEDALLPYEPFAEALKHLLGHAGTGFASHVERELSILARVFPGLGEFAGPTPAAVDQETLRYQFFEAVTAVLTRGSTSWPLLLVLDDLHWADKPTLRLLRHVLRHANGSRLLVIGTSRPGAPALIELLAALRRELSYDRLDLTGLDERDTHALVADRLTTEVTPGFTRRLQEQTGGNAFFIEETVRALGDSEFPQGASLDEAALERLGVPEGVEEMIVRRAHQLTPPAFEFLTAASVVGGSFRVEIVERLLDADPERVVAAAEESLAAGLVLEVPERPGVQRFSHALVHDVLYRHQLTAARRILLHHRVAEVLEELSEREIVYPAVLAHHFAHALPRAGATPARRYAIAAARRAAELFAYEEAAEHFRKALDLFPEDDDEGRCDILLALGRVQWHAGDDGARDTFLEAAGSAERRGHADQLARAALGLGERYFEVTYLGARYRDLLEKALAAVGPADSDRRALLLSRLAVNLAYPSEDEHGHALATEAVAMARRLGDEKLLVAVLMVLHVTLLDIRHIGRRLELSQELGRLKPGHRELVAELHHWRMYDLLAVGAREAARREHDDLEALAAELGQPLLRSLALGSRGLWAELTGDVELAESCAEQSLTQALRANSRDALSAWTSQVFALRRRQGRLGELAPAVERLARSGGHQLGWLSALGVLRFDTGDVEGARSIYELELQAGPDALPRGMFWLLRISLLSELCALLGDASRAEALYGQLAPHADYNLVVAYCSFWGPIDGYLALLADTAGDAQLAASHTRAALERTRAMSAPLLTADLEERYATIKRG